ncbi:Protein FLUORESCENT IN BLUE LIGHT, chloroplastic [Heracleum sosnowskyi]|uniref:Protein FLUORESCENT IN BLUE LIGHT, chloroplastic n=1 Tax=Heracleum sosnowskyi TaxID=360622 RepID=A0AAD8M379_9APIA|nr:Protein FLUORESCENT IN BLUE LIGHT, chloroplastic [Heracleum sosnowskyi]
MAVVVRCSSLLPRTISGTYSRRTPHLPVKTHFSGEVVSLLLKIRKGILPSVSNSDGPLDSHKAGYKLVNLQQDCIEQYSLKPTCLVGHKQNHAGIVIEHVSPHQIQSSSLALIIVNALMFYAPLQALAETCESDRSVLEMPVLLSVALVGATVGGLLARQRKGELNRLNEQLRQINAALRRQAKIESYAPALSYAPVGARIAESEVIIDPRKHDLISHLKIGKNYLRNQDPEKAFVEFKTALELAQNLKDPTEEKKAARGLGASLQRQGKYREAIKYHSMVLTISEREKEDSGNTEAYGAIADCYTELGDLERAGSYYDQYIARLETD